MVETNTETNTEVKIKEELKKLKCELCGEKAFALIPMRFATDIAFNPNKGICLECFKKGNIDERMLMKTNIFINEQIESAKQKKEFWSKELKRINE